MFNEVTHTLQKRYSDLAYDVKVASDEVARLEINLSVKKQSLANLKEKLSQIEQFMAQNSIAQP